MRKISNYTIDNATETQDSMNMFGIKQVRNANRLSVPMNNYILKMQIQPQTRYIKHNMEAQI